MSENNEISLNHRDPLRIHPSSTFHHVSPSPSSLPSSAPLHAPRTHRDGEETRRAGVHVPPNQFRSRAIPLIIEPPTKRSNARLPPVQFSVNMLPDLSFEKRGIQELKYFRILLCIFRKERHMRIDVSLNLVRLSLEKNTRIDIFCYVATFVRHIFRKERNTRIEISLNLANMLPDLSFEK